MSDFIEAATDENIKYATSPGYPVTNDKLHSLVHSHAQPPNNRGVTQGACLPPPQCNCTVPPHPLRNIGYLPPPLSKKTGTFRHPYPVFPSALSTTLVVLVFPDVILYIEGAVKCIHIFYRGQRSPKG